MAKRRPTHPFDWSHRHWSLRPLWLRNFRRQHRWLVRAIVGVPVLLLIVLVILTRSPLTRYLVTKRIQSALNVEFDADAVYVRANGDTVVDRARFRLPGIPGQAGEFLTVARVTAEGVNWFSLLTGAPRARVIVMDQPVVVISQSIDDGSVNIGSLSLPASSGSMAIPPVQIRNGGVEIGEHRGGQYHPLRHVLVDGFFRPSEREGPGGYQFRLQESTTRSRKPGEKSQPGFLVNGALADGRISVTVENFTLDDWPAQSVPSHSRERFADLNLRGDVPRASLRYTEEDGLTASLELHGVGMNLPLEPTSAAAGVEGAQGPFPRFVRMRDVSGTITFARESIRATVRGLLEDMPYQVTLNYQGLSENSPFTCDFTSEGFKVERNPGLLPYAPAEVRKWLTAFSSPTAIVNTHVIVRRGAPAGESAGEITVAGDMTLSQGSAAYERFPYRFEDIVGRFHFSNEEVRIVEVSGHSAAGATLHADGLIAPLDDTSEVTVNVEVKGAPIDDAMEAAFGPQRSQVLRALFNKDRYADLVKAGLIQSRQDAMAISQELETLQKQQAAAPSQQTGDRIAELQRRIQTPIFDFRGTADVSVRVHSPRGKNQPYHNLIDISLPTAGIVAEKFPLPIAATGVKIHIDNDDGQLVAGDFRAIGGGEAGVKASFSVPGRDVPDVHPVIDIAVRQLPFSELLIYALPAGDGEGASIKRMLRDLGISGTGSGSVHIASRDGKGDDDLGFDADFAVSNGVLEPAPRPAGPLRIDAMSGTLHASESDLNLSLSGRVMRPDAAPEAGPAAGGPVTARLTAQFSPKGDPAPSTYRLEVGCPGLSLSCPAETLVAVFSPDAADQLQRLRARYGPEGAANIATTVDSHGKTRVDVALAAAGDLSATLMGDRLTLLQPSGQAHVVVDNGVVLQCQDLSAIALFGDHPTGSLTLNGAYLLRPGPAAEPPLTLSWRDAPFQSSLVSTIVRERFGADIGGRYDAASPKGFFDAEMTLRAGAGDDGASEPDIRGVVKPRSVSFSTSGTPVSFERMTGQIEFEPGAGVVRRLTAEAADWSGTVDGAWESRATGGFSARAQISGKAQRLTGDLKAVLPANLREVLADLNVSVSGPFSVEDATLDLGRFDDPSDDWTRFSGAVSFSNASLQAGIPISDLAGRIDAKYKQEPDSPASFHLDIGADSFKISGVSLGHGQAVVESGLTPGTVLVPLATGECYGGRFSARASVEPGSGKNGREYEADVQLSGARFRPLLDDLTEDAPTDAAPDDPSTDFSRGELDAELSLHGVMGHPELRRGRGSFRVSGGRVVNFPFMVRMIEVSNLALPSNSRLDFAAGSFYLDSGLISFDDLTIHSKTIAIEGYGTMTWPEKILDLRFNSRSERPIPILSTLVQGIRDELVTTTVKGPLGEQEVRLQQFPGTRRMLGRAMGSGESEQNRRLTGIERRARDVSIRPNAPGIRAAPPERTSAAYPDQTPGPQP